MMKRNVVESSNNFHIAMFPFFSLGHMIPFLHLSNELAARSHRISFLTPKKAQIQLPHLNLHPNTFCPITVPHVEGLPEGIEFSSEVPTPLIHLFCVVVDQNHDQIQAILKANVLDHYINLIFFYFVHWVPEITRKLGVGIKFIYYIIKTLAVHAFSIVPARNYNPSLTVYGLEDSNKNGLPLEDMWAKWLGGFEEAGSVVFCAFGSQLILEKDQFQELVLGFELIGLLFFVVLKPPTGCTTIEERESLLGDKQIVLVLNLCDQIMNTKLLVKELKVVVEVESLSKTITTVMDKENELGVSLKKNLTKWRRILSEPGFMSGYIDRFIHNLKELCNVVN
ncbi:hypothetical protein Pyn_07282 [Prunus yedoensis var. nudiflora]|uniref:Uncharacterized protein n=1 Tax=Prunus yedoensis var. nudiflora TaxID=2094558 RepID=A0A314YC03_PRUYE|nr:hypothetical protein Pyn_07282 [Prunus yedoensis var. nudiflora]